MSDNIKVLAQVNPSSLTLTQAYVVPSNKTTTISSIVICNSGLVSYFRISVQVLGASDTISQYLYYDLPIDANDTFIATIGITLNAGDVVAVQSYTNNLSFNLFGLEIG